ncbi:MAG: T9SS type A sorting domain-containing protein, partial [Saprospiraceae bacterium]
CFLNVEKACDLTLNTSALAVLDGLSIYPNPAATSFSIEGKGKSFSRIQIFDSMGRRLRQFELNKPVNEFVVSSKDLPPGAYFIQVENRILPLLIQR